MNMAGKAIHEVEGMFEWIKKSVHHYEVRLEKEFREKEYFPSTEKLMLKFEYDEATIYKKLTKMMKRGWIVKRKNSAKYKIVNKFKKKNQWKKIMKL